MRENRDFVVPVNILTTFGTPRFLGPHDTLPCVLIPAVFPLQKSDKVSDKEFVQVRMTHIQCHSHQSLNEGSRILK